MSENLNGPQKAFQKARRWFWTLVILGAVGSLVFVVNLIGIVDGHPLSGNGENLIFFGLLSGIPCVQFWVHAAFARYYLKKGWENPWRALCAVWGGTIGITVPLGGFWVLAIFTDRGGGDGQGVAIAFILAVLIALISTPIGYLLGYFIGLSVERFYAHQYR